VTIRLRLARPADARALARLRDEFRRGYAHARGARQAALPAAETPAAFVTRCTAWMRRALRDRRRWRCWVAVAVSRTRAADAAGAAGRAAAAMPERLVGHVWLQVIDKVPNPGAEAEQHAYITNLYVQPEARGGTGQRLLAAAMDWCRARQMDSVILWPTDESRSLYARNGFAVSGTLVDLRLTGPHLNESLRMRASRRPASIARSSATRRVRTR
jgi:GNAT superfamily N-acetyltransferase